MTTPTCPACGAKFSHDNASMTCKKCGLPDGIREAGAQAIHLWKKGKLPYATSQPQTEFSVKRGARLSRKARRHGRPRSRGRRVYRA